MAKVARTGKTVMTGLLFVFSLRRVSTLSAFE